MNATGADFDPELHEAISQAPAASEADKNKIIQIGGFIQEWINIMEYMDGGYHLNVYGIKDINTLIIWVFIMASDIKFIPSTMKI